MKIVFMGTPDFAVRQLCALYENRDTADFQITGVITQPDKPKGRGHSMLPPPVKAYALENGLRVEQPQTLRDDSFAALLQTLDPDLIVVAAYGKLLPVNVLQYPRYGCINVHGSLLPKYRGAAPIQRAVMDGCSESGVTIMYMEQGMDTGDMLAKQTVPILADDDAGAMYEKLAQVGAALLLETIPGIISGTVCAEKQTEENASYAPKIEKADTFLSFETDARTLHNRIRGLSPSPLGQVLLLTDRGEKPVKITKTVVLQETQENATPGEVVQLDVKNGMIGVACQTGVLGICSLIPQGKNKMGAADFIRGRQIALGDRLVCPKPKE